MLRTAAERQVAPRDGSGRMRRRVYRPGPARSSVLVPSSRCGGWRATSNGSARCSSRHRKPRSDQLCGRPDDPAARCVSRALETLRRMIEGWLLACLAGIVLGAMIGTSAAARAWLQPMLEFIRPLPASAMMPLAISIFGLGPNMVLFVVAFGATWPVLLATLHGFAGVEPRLARGGRCAADAAARTSSGRWACPAPCPTSWPACDCR